MCYGGGEESCGIYAKGNITQELDEELLDMEGAWAAASGISGQGPTNDKLEKRIMSVFGDVWFA